MTSGDEELMAAIRRRDAAAFEVLFALKKESVYRRLFHVVQEAATAEDLVQEVFLRVWTHAHQWSGLGSVDAWIAGIAGNLALNHLRTAARRRQRTLCPPPTDRDDGEASTPDWLIDHSAVRPETILDRAERIAQVRQVISELPEEKREALRLVIDSGLDVREAAERLGIPEGTMKSRLHHARKEFADRWKQSGF